MATDACDASPRRVLLAAEQRSGTTLLLQTLAAQTGTAVASGRLAGVMDLAWRWGIHPEQALTMRQRTALLRSAVRSWRRSGAESELSLGVEGFDTFGDLLRAIFDRSARRGDVVSVQKHHCPAELLPSLLDLPQLRVLYLVRDARDVILSRRYRGDAQLDRSLLRWREAARVLRRIGSHTRLQVVRFETLVHSPESVLGDLQDLLGFTPDPRRITLGRDRFNTSFGDLEFPFDTRAVARWKQHWHEPVVRYVAWACRHELELLGYDAQAVDTLGGRERLGYAARRLRAETSAEARRRYRGVRRWVLTRK